MSMMPLIRDLITASLLLGASLPMVAAPALADDFVLNVNTPLDEQDPLWKGLEAFKARVETRTDGKLRIRLYSGSKLGKDEELLAVARTGQPYAIVTDGGRLAVFAKEFGVLGAPYLANGYEGVRKVVTSDLFAGWTETLRKTAGLQILSFNWWQGERHLLTNKPVTSPADLKGLKLRTPGAPVWTETVRAMGATPVAMGWSEVRTAIEHRIIDGAEAQHPATYGAKLYDVVKTVTKTGHINLITGIVTSAAWFDGLPEDYRRILREESLKAGDEASRATSGQLADFEARMKAQGVTIADIDVTPFREATAAVYEKLGYKELREQVDLLLKN